MSLSLEGYLHNKTKGNLTNGNSVTGLTPAISVFGFPAMCHIPPQTFCYKIVGLLGPGLVITKQHYSRHKAGSSGRIDSTDTIASLVTAMFAV